MVLTLGHRDSLLAKIFFYLIKMNLPFRFAKETDLWMDTNKFPTQRNVSAESNLNHVAAVLIKRNLFSTQLQINAQHSTVHTNIYLPVPLS